MPPPPPPPPPSILIDVGAHKGRYTDVLLNSFPNATIHIFEPSQLNINILNRKFSSQDNVIVNPVGLSNIEASLTLFSNQLGADMASLTKRRADHYKLKFDKSEKVRVIKFINYYNKRLSGQIIDLLKIDVEGHEMNVLEGCGEIIRKIRCVQFEFSQFNIDTKIFFQDFWLFFKERDFDIYLISPSLGLIKIKQYSERYEYFYKATNYIALNQKIAESKGGSD